MRTRFEPIISHFDIIINYSISKKIKLLGNDEFNRLI